MNGNGGRGTGDRARSRRPPSAVLRLPASSGRTGADILPDILAPELDVIFVGAAPSYYAAERGHYYAGPRNRFWLLLYQAEFTDRQLHETEDARVLSYGIGLTAILKDAVSSDNTKLPPPTNEDRSELRARLLECSPLFVCYNGRDVFRMCCGIDAPRWGLQKELLGRSRQFVVHSTSGRADRWGADRLFLFRELKHLVDAERARWNRTTDR